MTSKANLALTKLAIGIASVAAVAGISARLSEWAPGPGQAPAAADTGALPWGERLEADEDKPLFFWHDDEDDDDNEEEWEEDEQHGREKVRVALPRTRTRHS